MTELNLDRLASLNNVEINLEHFLISILLSSFLALIIQFFYIKFSTTLSNKKEFSKIFVVLCATTTIVITIVKSSLALSLGLVGALSIVRFRAAIKEPEELAYLFLLIAVGLGCGALQFKITIYGVTIILILIYLFSKFNYPKKINSSDKLNISILYAFKASERILNEHKDLLIKKCKFVKLRSISKTESDTSVNFEIQLSDFNELNKLIGQIQKKNIKCFIADDDILTN